MADYRDKLDEWRDAARRKAREVDEKYNIPERDEESAGVAGGARRASWMRSTTYASASKRALAWRATRRAKGLMRSRRARIALARKPSGWATTSTWASTRRTFASTRRTHASTPVTPPRKLRA